MQLAKAKRDWFMQQPSFRRSPRLRVAEALSDPVFHNSTVSHSSLSKNQGKKLLLQRPQTHTNTNTQPKPRRLPAKSIRESFASRFTKKPLFKLRKVERTTT